MTLQPQRITEALLARYLASDCTPMESRDIEQWLEQSATNREMLEQVRAVWAATPVEPRWDVDAMWRSVRRTMDTSQSRSAGANTPRIPAPRAVVPQPTRPITRRYWIAGAVAAAAGLVFVIARPMQKPAPESAAPIAREYATQRGQHATIQLTDGTTLILAAASRVRIPGDFGVRTRELYLEGEAVFDVVHDSTRPFRVHSKDAVIEDIGTRFDIRAYAEDSVVTVAVVQGSVALAHRRPGADAATEAQSARVPEGVLLHEGYVGTLGAEGRVSTRRDPAIARRVSWTDGRLEFSDARLDDVLQAIGRWYDVDLRVGDADLSSRAVTATFSIQSVEQMVHALSLAVDARVERNRDVIMLRNKR